MRLKKVMATGLVAALALSTMVGCSSKKDSSDQKKIGVVQLVEHDALDASYKGFKDGLEKAGYKDGDKIKIEYKNAQNEQSNCQTIAKQFVTDKCDLVLAIATPAAQAMANESKDIPILVTAVTDPADAKLVKSNKKPGTNVSGTSDLTPVAKQMNLLKELIPNAKKVAMLYCSAEANSLYQIQLFEAALDKDGIAYKEYAIADTNEVQSVTTAAAGECDVLYIPTDNTLASVTETVYNVVAPAKIPVIAGEEGICNGCGVATLSISYYDLGYATGEMAYEILAEGADITTMDVRYAPNVTKKYNAKICEELGITVPDDYVAIQ